MADSLGTTLSRPLKWQHTKTLTSLITLRLFTAYTLLVVSLVGLLGADWDIQWHATIGRDRTFTPPHIMILAGIGLAGITALISILIETWWTGQNHELAQNSTDFLGMIRSSLGSYFVGFGAVSSAIAFPLDTYWHSLYGIDVSLWAPFHTMIYMGGILSTIGITYIFLSTAHLAQSQQQLWPIRLAYSGVLIMFAILLSKLCTFFIPALQGHTLSLDLSAISFYPFFLSAGVVFVCILATRLIPWPGTATLTILVFLAVSLLARAFIPPMMTWLMQAEHQTYLARAIHTSSLVLPLTGQSPLLLLTGLSIDGIILLGKRLHWSPSILAWRTAFTAALSATIAAALILIMLSAALASEHSTNDGNRVIPFLLSLVFAMLGGLLGSWFAITISQTVEGLRR